MIQTQSAGTDGAWQWGFGVSWLPLPQMGAPGNRLAPLPPLHNPPWACTACGRLLLGQVLKPLGQKWGWEGPDCAEVRPVDESWFRSKRGSSVVRRS